MKSIKILILLIVFCRISFHSYSQLNVDAGNDTSFCRPADTIYLGENARIENAVEKVQIAWECELNIGSHIFTASDLLSDTTILTPYFIDYPISPEWITFTLHVTDSVGDYAKDSIKVRFSNFAYSLYEYHFDIHQGDSIQFDGQDYIAGGVPPLNIVWTPSYGLSDSTILAAWAKPDTSTSYYQVAIDSVGCISLPNLVYVINIIPAKIQEIFLTSFFKQQGTKLVFNNIQKKKVFLSVYSINGELVYTEQTNNNFCDLARILEFPGIYICSIAIDNRNYSLKFIKN
ncbi:MAG: hypothetical protein DRJ01_09360 [Bacteroidetes bacterium]|nr:MAG: hypothetical protein DRJ01_09360 [Bacteroidota bacterium]